MFRPSRTRLLRVRFRVASPFAMRRTGLLRLPFRNGPIENLHAGKSSPLTADPSLSRITDDEMKELMVNASEVLAAVLALRDSDPDKYRRFIQDYALKYCRRWNR